MKLVRRLTHNHRTVLSVIHQPASEVFELFDKLCLLSQGRIVYFGPAAQAADFFADAGLRCPAMRNPSDHFLHCINTDFTVRRATALSFLRSSSRRPKFAASMRRPLSLTLSLPFPSTKPLHRAPIAGRRRRAGQHQPAAGQLREDAAA